MARELATHEDLTRKNEVEAGSPRAFGIVFTVVFAIIAAVPLIGGAAPRWWSVIVAIVFLVLALAVPKALTPLNRLWFAVGKLLHGIVSPLVMAAIFYLTITPIALIMRVAGKVPMALEFDAEAESYWIHREPPGPEPETMRRQF